MRSKTGYEHGWEIAEAYGYRRASDPVVLGEFTGFLAARTATRTERSLAVFDQAVAWLRREKVLLPGVSLVTRLVAESRAEANERLFSLLSDVACHEYGTTGGGFLPGSWDHLNGQL